MTVAAGTARHSACSGLSEAGPRMTGTRGYSLRCEAGYGLRN